MSRAKAQASSLSSALRRLGAEVVEAPAIRIEPPKDWSALDAAIESLSSYDWIIFTSVNGVTPFVERMKVVGKNLQQLTDVRLAAIGPATRRSLASHGLRVKVVPERYVAEEVFEALRKLGPLRGSRILLPRADIAREALPDLLRKEGASVDVVVAYRTVSAKDEMGRALDLVARGQVDVVTFTSGSTVRGFFSAIDDKEVLRDKFLCASIGPITSGALREQGFTPGIEASEYTTEGLVEAIARHFANDN